VINGGLNSATSAELLAKWIFRDRYLKPDIVIVCGPGNDIWPLMFPNYDPEYTHYRRTWNSVPTAARAGERLLLRSAAARVAYAWWLDRSQAPMGIFRDPTAAPRIAPADALRAVQQTEPIGYERNMSQLVRDIIADGARPVLFKMFRGPRAVFAVLPPAARGVEPLYDAVEVAQSKEAEIGQRLAASVGAPWVALADNAVPLADFIDHAHLTADGERITAQRLVDTVAELLRPRGVERH
jgi:lysophospholipase L1-like esterase